MEVERLTAVEKELGYAEPELKKSVDDERARMREDDTLNEVTQHGKSLEMDEVSLKKWLEGHLSFVKQEWELECEEWERLWQETENGGDGDSLEMQKCKRETAARLPRLQAESRSLKEMIGLLEAIVTTAQDAMCASAEERYSDEKLEGDSITLTRTLSADAEAPGREMRLFGRACKPYGGLSCTTETVKNEMPSVEDVTNELLLGLLASDASESRQRDSGEKSEIKKCLTESRRTKRSVVPARGSQSQVSYVVQIRGGRRERFKVRKFRRRTGITGLRQDARQISRSQRRVGQKIRKQVRIQKQTGSTKCSEVESDPAEASLAQIERDAKTRLGPAPSWSARRPRLGG
ncbi:unnamed protein product [Ixodes pacificus]